MGGSAQARARYALRAPCACRTRPRRAEGPGKQRGPYMEGHAQGLALAQGRARGAGRERTAFQIRGGGGLCPCPARTGGAAREAVPSSPLPRCPSAMFSHRIPVRFSLRRSLSHTHRGTTRRCGGPAAKAPARPRRRVTASLPPPPPAPPHRTGAQARPQTPILNPYPKKPVLNCCPMCI